MKKLNFILIIAGMAMLAGSVCSCKKTSSTSCRISRVYSTDSFNRSDLVYDGNTFTQVNYFLKSGASQGHTVYHYSSTGKLSGFEDLDSNGIVLRKTEYLFDGQGKVITENYYVKSGSSLPLSAHYSYEYYSNGNLKKYTRYDNGSTVMETTYYLDYDANGNNTKGYTNNNLGITVDTFFYTYDAHPNFQAQYNYLLSLNKNNALTYIYKPTIGSVFAVTYTYRYNDQGLVTYQKESGAGEEYFVDYICSN